MFTIENDQLRISVKSKGAELDSLFSKETGLEYLWSGDPAFWAKKSPILFPIVGTLKHNTYHYNNKAYHLTRHGFARDRDFMLTAQTQNSVTLTLASDDATLAVYPFTFRLQVVYTVVNNELEVKYIVLNEGQNNMFFSIGGHPAFRLPLEEDIAYDDYYFEFSQLEDARRWMISHDGLIEPTPIPFITNDSRLDISKDIFRHDAIVFKYLNSDSIKLKTKKSRHGLEVRFPRFPFLGLWAAPNADFICIEPWCGIADSTSTKQEFINKEGINLLTPGQQFERKWSVVVY
jgi:galactose mutarotase-like enzyme